MLPHKTKKLEILQRFVVFDFCWKNKAPFARRDFE